MNNKIIITGSIGFIGAALSLKLLEREENIIGIDNHNDYYDVSIKEARLKRLKRYQNYQHYKLDICDKKNLDNIFEKHKPQRVINLAAQAGVRYSIENPLAYVNTNIVGFTHILENCRNHKIDHLIYASTSSVYGANTKTPFSEHDNANHPLSVYAVSKKLMS
jgi:UDP-glucuronate 4-epimerase